MRSWSFPPKEIILSENKKEVKIREYYRMENMMKMAKDYGEINKIKIDERVSLNQLFISNTKKKT